MLPNYREIIKEYCHRLKYDITHEEETDKLWYIMIKTIYASLAIEKKVDYDFVFIFYTLRIENEDHLKLLDGVNENPDFRFGMNTSLINTRTSMRYIFDNNQMRGYHISKKIFPDDATFTIREFEEAIIAVEGVGISGIAYLDNLFGSSLFNQKNGNLPKTEPGQEFG